MNYFPEDIQLFSGRDGRKNEAIVIVTSGPGTLSRLNFC